MAVSRKHLAAAWKFVECLGALAIIAWLIYPYPYTWDELGKIVPGAEYGVFIPSLIYIWLSLRQRYRSGAATDEKATSNDPA